MSIFKLIDIDTKVLSNLDLLDDYSTIMLINKYYLMIVTNNDAYKNLLVLKKYITIHKKDISKDISKDQNNSKKFYRYLCKLNKTKDKDKDRNDSNKLKISFRKNLLKVACRVNNPLCKYLFGEYDSVTVMKILVNCCKYKNLEFANWIVAKQEFSDMLQLYKNANPTLIYNNCYWKDYKLLEILQSDIFDIYYRACSKGDLEVAKWVNSLPVKCIYISPIDTTTDDYLYLFKKICLDCNINVAQWMINSNGPPIKNNRYVDMNNIFSDVCEIGHFAVAKWLINLCNNDGYIPIDIHYNGETPFILRRKGKNLDILKWLIELGSSSDYTPIDIHVNDEEPFRQCCIYGNFDIAKWLVDLGNSPGYTPIDIHVKNEEPFRQCCNYGYIDIAQWLFNLSMQPNYRLINIHVNNEYALRLSCKNGHIEFAKWLIELRSHNQISINLLNELFTESCSSYGNLNTIKWLIGLSNHLNIGVINIHAYNELAFRRCCSNGEIELAKFLIDLGNDPKYGPINIHVKEDIAFILSCDSDIDLAKFLVDLSHQPMYHPVLELPEEDCSD